jgi:hypothetical protein
LQRGGEAVGESSLYPRPGADLRDEHMGSAHRLVRRTAESRSRIPAAAIRFVAPQRLQSGAIARGSMLHYPSNLRGLFAWPRRDRTPDLQVVLVDEDGDESREELLAPHVGTGSLPGVLTVVVREYEGWLIADPKAVSDASGSPFNQPPRVETLRPKEAKQWLEKHLERLPADERHAVRLRIAETVRLDRLSN